MLRHFLAYLFLLFGSTSNAVAQNALAERLEDLRLETAVRLALAENAETRNFPITVEADDGKVVLEGLVPTLSSRDLVVALATDAAEGVTVRSLIRLQGRPGEPIPDAPAVGSRENPQTSVDPEQSSREGEGAQVNGAHVFYTVRRGDTLYSIAQRYESTVDAISALNNLQSTTVRIGQRLRVR